ncbi:MAG TPA: helix-turn-helix transcriptional regulator [Terriglobales bacterium]|nr:helix-turn-helix transcriptional regulator [Terriglobales bacterium]
MTTSNHLRMHRKQGALSQAEIGELLGLPYQYDVSRYERGVRSPRIPTLIAAELLFGENCCDLFPGLSRGIAEEMLRRVRGLRQKLGGHRDAVAMTKRRYLLVIARRLEQRLQSL